MAKKRIEIDKAVTTTNGTAYAAGDNIGGLLQLKSASGKILPKSQFCRIKGIILGDLGKQDTAVDVVIFSSNPSGTTFTNDAAQDIADADLTKIVHVENLTAYDDFADNSVAGAVSLDVSIGFTDAIYIALVSRGTPTYTSTGDLKLKIIVEYDE